jgi:radical SAM superfamily enzyme YgiQ (UPF0313 family)
MPRCNNLRLENEAVSVAISFADLTHTGQVVAANTFPYGISLVAAYAKEKLGDRIDVEIFKYPDDFSKYLDHGIPRVACFSNFLWNRRLVYAYARRIKEVSPDTVIILGGPNYPGEADAQHRYLLEHPHVDFYVWMEGEQALAGLLELLLAEDFDVAGIKARRQAIPSVHYVEDGDFVRGELLPRITDLTLTPSPYEMGLVDKFFDGVLIPMIETNRGCPFQCSFCEIGRSYFNKVRRSNAERIGAELEYIAKRVAVPDLLVVDSNFGMFREDLETCRIIADLKKRRNWPRYVLNSSGKNQKERVLEAARILDGAMVLTISIQSADENVLKNVKRSNIALDQIIEVGKHAETLGANSYCEIILGLPGDSREAHLNSVRQMIDANINDVLMYQTMMLPGSEVADKAHREKFGMVTRFRALPRCFGHYQILGQTESVAEAEEICVAQDSLSYQDYLDCRRFNLSVELFHNGGAFRELELLLIRHGIKASEMISACHALVMEAPTALTPVYDGFMRENEEKLWERREDLDEFLSQPGIIDRYITGELGSSELYKYKAMAFFDHQADLHDIAFRAARQVLASSGALGPDMERYLSQLARWSLIRKDAMLETGIDVVEKFDFDFVALEAGRFEDDPANHAAPAPVAIRISHTAEQRDLIASYLRQYGTTINGLGRLLLRSHVNKLYRKSGHWDQASVPAAAQ